MEDAKPLLPVQLRKFVSENDTHATAVIVENEAEPDDSAAGHVVVGMCIAIGDMRKTALWVDGEWQKKTDFGSAPKYLHEERKNLLKHTPESVSIEYDHNMEVDCPTEDLKDVQVFAAV